MVQTVVISSRQLDADPERVWAYLVDPHGAPALQPGTEVLRTHGADGTVGSGYEVLARQGPLRMPLELQVSHARPYEELLVLIKAAGRVVATGHYVLAAGPRDSTRLTVSTTAPGLLARLTRRATRKQQDAWLERLALQLA